MDRWEELRQLLGWTEEPLEERDFDMSLSSNEWKAVYDWLRRQEHADDNKDS
jgi:hypothetical protein